MPLEGHSPVRFQPVFGTSVLSCGCGIPWQEQHRKMSVQVCRVHGVAVIIQIR